MKERMAKFLKELYSNLGLPENVLNSVAIMAVVGLADDSTDDVIKARAQEEYVKTMLQDFQSHADKRATDARRAAEEKNKGAIKEEPNKADKSADTPEWAKQFMEIQSASIKTLTEKIAALENANATKSFDETVSVVAKELELSGAVLDLCKAGLSSNMDEATIRTKLGEAKKILIDNGASFGGSGSQQPDILQAQKDTWKKEEEGWVRANTPKLVEE